MPYEVAKNSKLCPSSKPWAVTLKDGGKLIACHLTQAKADSQVAVIYSSEGKK